MTHYASTAFWHLYAALPAAVRDLADKNFELLRVDPRHPSLHFKRIGSLWSVRVGGHYWPHVDVRETDSQFKVYAELPGLDEKDVEVTFMVTRSGTFRLKCPCVSGPTCGLFATGPIFKPQMPDALPMPPNQP